MINSFRTWLSIFAFLFICTISFSQNSSSLVLDASSLTPVNTDAITGLTLDPIAKDRSNRSCARIKLHVNRMTPQEIKEYYMKNGMDKRDAVKSVAHDRGVPKNDIYKN